jgi:hypothetical protein
MTLLLQPNADGSPEDYGVFHRTWRIGQIYKRAAAHTPDTEWTWVFNGVPDGPAGLARAGSAESRERAEVALQERWEQWLAWAGLSDGAAL